MESAPIQRSLTLLNGTGHIEVSWEPENDEAMRLVIEKKMKEGVRFFIMKKPVFGIPRRAKLKSVNELETRTINFDDPDLEQMFAAGKITVARAQGNDSSDEAPTVAKTAQEVVTAPRAVGVKALQGG